MAVVIPFDTLAFVKDLETSGVPLVQAEAHARALTSVLRKVEEARADELATKRDLKELEIRLEARFDTRLAETKAEIVRWLFTVSAGQAMLIIAILKLFPGQ
ncbi:MAG: DUF1640 domain-containing protein [Magnetococcales bacterium]|nr:DUF1640 domain-containing protein [Magnetococcales bacterium]MBF0323403.1 DUF1640 domain-containing protein [Magnetococcales bacterium]